MDIETVVKTKYVDEMTQQELLSAIDYHEGRLKGAIEIQEVVSGYLKKLTPNDEMTEIYFDLYTRICDEIRDINISGIECIQEYTKRYLH